MKRRLFSFTSNASVPARFHKILELAGYLHQYSPFPVGRSKTMTHRKNILRPLDSEFTDYLRDESRQTGSAQSISFPLTEEDLCEHIRTAAGENREITVQGARTGITAGAVPERGHIINLSRMTGIKEWHLDNEHEEYSVTVLPGLTLAELRSEVREQSPGKGPLFFPPDPTETSASTGGMTASNASGARSFYYGPTRKYIRSMRIVLGTGETLALKRGREKASGRSFSLKTLEGSDIHGSLPEYAMPSGKNAAGYFNRPDMDMIDLFIGAEGTLGIISEIELVLVPSPSSIWGIMAFFPEESPAIGFVSSIRKSRPKPAAIEFFDINALKLVEEQRNSNPAFAELPAVPPGDYTGVYVEYHCAAEEAAEEGAMQMAEIMAEFGGDEDNTWLASDEKELLRLKDFRHAVPEAVNLMIDLRKKKEPQLTKLGTDFAVPDEVLTRMFDVYRRGLSENELEHVIFGHIGDNHVHVNILPRSLEEYRRGRKLCLGWARKAAELGGTVSAEHGIGKLKKIFFEQMYSQADIEQMRQIKRLFDPSGILNNGNLFTSLDKCE